MSYHWLLPLLLYMDFGGTKFYSFKTENCFSRTSGSQITRFNRVYHGNELYDVEVETIKSQFGTLPFTWIIEVHDKKAAHILEKHGFIQFHEPFYGMSADIRNIDEMIYAPYITIKEIHEKSDREKLIDIIARSNSINDKEELTKAINDLLVKGFPFIKLYLGFYNQELCAASIFIYHEDAVTLHMVSTLPEYRCKGIGFAITHTGLLDASRKGITKAFLMSSLMGQSLYRKIGFEEYTHYYVYIYKQ